MGFTLVGLAGLQRGLESNETGLNAQGFSCRYYPQFKDKRNNYQGQAVAFAVPDKPTREATITGDEITGSATGVMAANFATAFVPSNDVGQFVAVASGTNSGGFYMDEVTVDQSADGWRTITARFTSDPLIS
jgi:hypothetical protein